ncbi:MAG: sigma-70 family RNA polymerase sigma factor [Anaerolineae bacterium]|nr:MAG: sigma-70 family RNA polymerase sigma factor [Anaerolineae bacterium]
MPNTDVLIERWRNGDERAAEALYNGHRDPVFRLAHGLLGDPSDAEEVAQDALTYALVNIHRYDPNRASFTTWLHTIAVSRCRDRHRRRRLPSLSLTAWLGRGGDVADSAPAPERLAIQSEVRSQVWEAVQALSQPLREAILLRYWASHTYREMAEILDCPVGTAQSRVRLAYQRLREALAAVELTNLEQGELS